jgi:hypothetical protein
LIVLSKSSLLGWFLHVSLIVIIKGRSPMEVSLIQEIVTLSPKDFGERKSSLQKSFFEEKKSSIS